MRNKTSGNAELEAGSLEALKPVWEREPPFFINEIGVKWWKEEYLTRYAQRPDSFGTTLDASAFVIERPDGYRCFVLLRDDKVVGDAQQSEAIAVQIDVMKMLKRDNERETTPQAQHPLAINTRVRFTEKWLAKSTPEEVKRYRNRVGIITGYRMGATEPIVTFPKVGRYKEQRFFEVPLQRLEVVPD